MKLVMKLVEWTICYKCERVLYAIASLQDIETETLVDGCVETCECEE